MPDETVEDLRRLIDTMQAGLVELFNQLHELKRRLNIAEQNDDKGTGPSVVPIFAEISKIDDTQNDSSSPASKDHLVPEKSRVDMTEPSEESDSLGISSLDSELPSVLETGIARVLDPILHELQTGESPGEVLAEYVQAAKDYLLPDPTMNERVAHDMDVVLKFLRARGKKSIRPDECDSIIRRIDQWKKHLARHAV